MAKTPRRRSHAVHGAAKPDDTDTSPTRFSHGFLGVRSSLLGFTEWVYVDPAARLAIVLAPGFFQPADDVLRGGDTILATVSDGAVLLWVQPGSGPLELRPFGMTGT